MSKQTNRNIDILLQMLILYWDGKQTYITSKSVSLHIHNSDWRPLHLTESALIDMSSVVSSEFKKNILFITTYALASLKLVSIYLYNPIKPISRSFSQPIYEWYERELYEKTQLFFINLIDMRGLLLNYSVKNLSNVNSILCRNTVYTDSFTKKTQLRSNFQIIL